MMKGPAPVIVSTRRSPRQLDIARLSGRLRWALGLFRKTTGLGAVASVVTTVSRRGHPPALSPPLHPRCAKRLRGVQSAPCRTEWFIHLRARPSSPTVQNHTCPIGLRCSWVPITFDGHLVAVAKLVAGPETSPAAFSTAATVLKLIATGVCGDSLLSGLTREVADLRRSAALVARFAGVRDFPIRVADPAQPTVALVERALSYLHQHYQSHGLALSDVARAAGCNARYLTSRFTSVVGEHMHAYLVRLRVAHACRLLMAVEMPIKEAAYGAGFRTSSDMARAFRRHVGISPGGYRRIFGTR